jgi:Ca-activated chloride channel family protein
MSLQYPWFLLLLLLVPVLVWLKYHPGRQMSVAFSDSKTLKQLPVSWAVLGNRLLPVLYALGLMLLVLAISRPQKGLDESKVHTEALDIVLLIDVSTSMRATDGSRGDNRNRLEAAKDVIQSFIKKREHDRIGMVVFSGLPYTFAPLTLDHGWLIHQMDRIQVGMLSQDGTAIGPAIASATNSLRPSKAKSKVVILLTDGVNTESGIQPENVAQAAATLGIKIYTVGAGSNRQARPSPFGQPPPQIDEELLQKIADITEAHYFRAEDYAGLGEVYDQIDKLEKTEIEIEKFTRYQELFPPITLAAMALLIAVKLLSYSRIGRLL